MYFLIVEDPEIGRSLILVEGGTVCVIQADCPDKVCVHTGPISQEGEVIACPTESSSTFPGERGPSMKGG